MNTYPTGYSFNQSNYKSSGKRYSCRNYEQTHVGYDNAPSPLAPTTENIHTVARCVRDGGVVVAPSDTNMALTVSHRHPVATTSANRSGTVPDDRLADVDLAVAHVGDAADYLLGGEPEGTARASTICSLADGTAGEARILRRGDVTANDIEDATSLTVE